MTTEEMLSVEKFRISQAQITAMTINELLSKINELEELHREHKWQMELMLISGFTVNSPTYQMFLPYIKNEEVIIAALKERLATLLARANHISQSLSTPPPKQKSIQPKSA